MQKIIICFAACFLVSSAIAHPVRPRHDLIDVRTGDSTIRVVMYFASPDNIAQKVFYNPSTPAYFRQEVVGALANVQKEIATSGIGLLIIDAYKPNSIQKDIWASLQGQPNLTDPALFIRHTGGMAVDVLLINLADGTVVCPPFEYYGDPFPVGPASAECTQDDQAKYDTLNASMVKNGFIGQAPHFDFMRTRHVCYPLELSFQELAIN